MDNVEHFVTNHLGGNVPGSQKVLADMKNPNWTNQEGLHHMLDGLSKFNAGDLARLDMRFTNTCGTQCRFDVELTSGKQLEYKNYGLESIKGLPGNQLATYFGNVNSLDALEYVFNKKKLEAHPDVPAGGAIKAVKDEMQTRFDTPSVKQDIFDNIKNKPNLLRELGLPNPRNVTPDDLQSLIDDTGSELYKFITVI